MKIFDKHINVLLIEDSPADALALELMLGEVKTPEARVETTGRLDIGLKRLAEGGIDLVLLDLGLPDSLGLDTFKRTIAAAPEIPIVIVTGSREEELGAEAIKMGAQDLLFKGQFNRQLLIHSICYALERQAFRRLQKEQARDQEASERRFRKIIEQNADGIVIIDRQGIIRFANPSAEALWDRKADELKGEMFGFPMVQEETTEIDINRRNGKQIIAEMRVVEIEWGGEDVYLASLRDITDRKQTEEKLNKEQVFINAVLNSVHDGIAACNREGVLTLFNRATREFHGLPEEPIPAEEWAEHYDLFLSDGQTPMKKEEVPLFRALQGEEFSNVEMVIAPKNKKVLTIRASGRPLFDRDGNSLGAVVSMHDVTDRKRAEEALKESEEKYRLLVENNSDIIVVVQDGEFRFVNSNLTELLEISNEEILGKPFTEWIHPDDREMVLENYVKRLRGEEVPDTYDFRMINNQGNTRWLVIRPVVISWDGRPATLVFMCDITERKLAEQQIQRQSRVLEAINKVFTETLTAETAEEVARICLTVAEELIGSKFGFIGEKNPDGRFDTIAISNPGWDFCTMPRSKAARLIKDMEIRGIDRSVIRDGIPRIVNDPASHPDRVGTPEGHPHLTSFLGVPFKRFDKTIGMIGLGNREPAFTAENLEDVEALSLAFIEVLNRKRADKEIKESEARFRMLIETMHEGLIMGDENNCFTFANERFCEMLGYTRAEIMGRPAGFFLDEVNQRILQEQTALRKEGERDSYELTFTRRDGKLVFTLISPTGFFDESGRFTGSLAVVTDITQRKIMENQLLQAQKLESIGSLAAGIAHEINTPMQYVGNNTIFLQNTFTSFMKMIDEYNELIRTAGSAGRVEDIVGRAEYVQEIYDFEYLKSEIPLALNQSLEGIERVSAIVQSIKRFAHPDLGAKVPVDINQAIESAITVSRNEWKYVADLVMDFDLSLPPVPCVAGEFNQVILNIIINAAHAIADVVGQGDVGKGRITVTTRHIGDWAEIRIADTGPGIPESISGRIFDPFFTTKEVGRGTGQGLAIAYSVIVDKHKGFLGVDSEEGKGATFIIRLPLEPNQQPPAEPVV